MQTNPTHSNLFVRNIPATYDAASFETLFRQFGMIVGCRFFNKAPVPYAFIKLASIEEAHIAIASLDGSMMGGTPMMVKFADTDAMYENPNNNLYVKNIPLVWSEEVIKSHFSPYGEVITVRLLNAQPNIAFQGALIRMNCVEDAIKAKDAINAVVPPGESQGGASWQPLQAVNNNSSYGGGGGRTRTAPVPGVVFPGVHSMSGGGQANAFNPSYPQQQQQQQAYQMPASDPSQSIPTTVAVQQLPVGADRLWLFENFASYGGTVSVTLEMGGASAKVCYTDAAAAGRAVVALNGAPSGPNGKLMLVNVMQ
ncbi:MAG: hypothetical protein WDW38_008816 [Sanguina aurantia]